MRMRLEDIARRTLRLQDGRKIYVAGDHYVDGEGRELAATDDAAARALLAAHHDAATANEKDGSGRTGDRTGKATAGGGEWRTLKGAQTPISVGLMATTDPLALLP
jgi:hypothetical protein